MFAEEHRIVMLSVEQLAAHRAEELDRTDPGFRSVLL
jgi:hypothetical protein